LPRTPSRPKTPVISLAKNLCNLWPKICAICGYIYMPIKPAPPKAGGASTYVESPRQIRPLLCKTNPISRYSNERNPIF
jgi:rubredoxin